MLTFLFSCVVHHLPVPSRFIYVENGSVSNFIICGADLGGLASFLIHDSQTSLLMEKLDLHVRMPPVTCLRS